MQLPWEWMSAREERVSLLLAEAINQTPPPVTRILFPERFGYVRSAPTIEDVLATDRRVPYERVDFSGTPAGYAGTARPAMSRW